MNSIFHQALPKFMFCGNSSLKKIDFKRASGLIKFYAENCLFCDISTFFLLME